MENTQLVKDNLLEEKAQLSPYITKTIRRILQGVAIHYAVKQLTEVNKSNLSGKGMRIGIALLAGLVLKKLL